MISRPRAASTRIAGRHFPTGVSAAVLAILAVLAGCAQSQPATASAAHGTAPERSTSGAGTKTAGTGLSLPAMSSVPGAALTSLATGRLGFSDGCFFLTSLVNDRRMDLVWPFRYTARTSPLGVYDASGRLVARPDDAVAFGGGPVILAHVSAGTVVNTGCLAGASTAWFISSVGRA